MLQVDDVVEVVSIAKTERLLHRNILKIKIRDNVFFINIPPCIIRNWLIDNKSIALVSYIRACLKNI